MRGLSVSAAAAPSLTLFPITTFWCQIILQAEIDDAARAVLRARFPGVHLVRDGALCGPYVEAPHKEAHVCDQTC